MLTYKPEKGKILTMDEDTITKNPNAALQRILSEVVINRLREAGVEEQLIAALLSEHEDAVELLKTAFAKSE